MYDVSILVCIVSNKDYQYVFITRVFMVLYSDYRHELH